MTAVSLALTFAVPGGPAMTSEFITKTTAISAVPFLRGPPTYKEYETESKHFDIEAGTAATKGFFYLDEDVDDEYLLEVNNPDLFMVNSPVYSGGLTYSKYSPFDVESHSSLGGEICMIPTEAIGLNGDISSNPNLFNSENYCDNPLSFKFILENNEFNKIELVSLEGIKYTFEPTVIVTFSRVKQTKVPERDLVLNLDGACEKLYSQKRDYDYIEVNLTESYVSTWSLSRIESTRNSNDYIEFIYSNSVTRKTQSSPRCELLPDSRLSYSEIISDSKELIGIETPTYYADFNLGEEMETTGLMILPNGSASPKLKRLDSIDLIYKEDLIYDLSDELIESFKFNYAIKGETLNHPRGSLTLASVQECGMNLECFPKTKFEYSNNPVMFLDLTQESSNDFDRFGYYFNSPFEGKHAYGFGFDPNDATAWSLTKVSWSSGGSTEWDYISDSYNWIGNFSRFGWGGGIRVTKVQNCDGYDNCYNTYYSYSNGAINYLPGNYEGSLNDDTYSQGGSGVTMPKVIYDLVTVIKGNVSNYSFGEGNGKTVYNFTTAKDFPDKGPYIPPIFFETGFKQPQIIP